MPSGTRRTFLLLGPDRAHRASFNNNKTEHMNKYLMVLVAIIISVGTYAQSGAGICPNRPNCICHPAAAQAEAPKADAVAAVNVSDAVAPAPATAVAGAVAPCPNRPDCICPDGMKAGANATAAKSEGVAPCPNRLGCICH